MMDVFNSYRSQDGRIQLDHINNLQKTDLPTNGTHTKEWFIYDGALYLFKQEKLPLESIKEIINEELALAYGLENASYDLAVYQGKEGVISADFTYGHKFIPFLTLILQMKNPSNDLSTLCECLEMQKIEKEKINFFAQTIFRNYLLDIFTIQKDRNVTNQGFITKDSNYFLAPRYDSANSFLPIISYKKMENIKTDEKISQLTRKYEAYRTRFSLIPNTLSKDSILLLLALKYKQISCDNIYVNSALSLLDTEIQKIALMNTKEIFHKLKEYNISCDERLQQYIQFVFETRIREYEKKDQECRRKL